MASPYSMLSCGSASRANRTEIPDSPAIDRTVGDIGRFYVAYTKLRFALYQRKAPLWRRDRRQVEEWGPREQGQADRDFRLDKSVMGKLRVSQRGVAWVRSSAVPAVPEIEPSRLRNPLVAGYQICRYGARSPIG